MCERKQGDISSFSSLFETVEFLKISYLGLSINAQGKNSRVLENTKQRVISKPSRITLCQIAFPFFLNSEGGGGKHVICGVHSLEWTFFFYREMIASKRRILWKAKFVPL